MSFLQRACGPAGGGAHSIFKLNVGIRTLYLYTHTITRNGSHFTSPSLAEKGGFFRLSATRKRLREPSPSYTVQLHLAHTISIALRATAGFNSRGRTALHRSLPPLEVTIHTVRTLSAAACDASYAKIQWPFCLDGIPIRCLLPDSPLSFVVVCVIIYTGHAYADDGTVRRTNGTKLL
jgi:hypothetical protein